MLLEAVLTLIKIYATVIGGMLVIYLGAFLLIAIFIKASMFVLEWLL